METKSLQKFAPPGYFDLSQDNSEITKRIFEWLKNYREANQNTPTRFDFFYRLFLSVNYTEETSKDFLKFEASQYGLANVSLPSNSLKNLLIYVSTPKEKKLSSNIQGLINFLLLNSWISSFGDIVVGYNSRSNFAETLLVYSDSLTIPTTPSNTDYTPIEWLAPTDWTKTPLNSTYYCRGYLYEGQIIWDSPISTSLVVKYDTASDLSSLPSSPSLGDVCLVTDDTTDDFQSVYYYNGTSWKKNSTPNASQQNINTAKTTKGSEVFATDNLMITSQTQPPNDGYSQGYGFYGIFGSGSLVNRVNFRITLTEEGNKNLGLIVQLAKKIKPVGNLLVIYAIYDTTTYLLEINDINAI